MHANSLDSIIIIQLPVAWTSSLFLRICLHLNVNAKSHLARFPITILFLLFLKSLRPLNVVQGVWKFNNSLLDDKVFCDIIRNLIQDHVFSSASFASPQDWWEFLKGSIKEKSISFRVESAVDCVAIRFF